AAAATHFVQERQSGGPAIDRIRGDRVAHVRLVTLPVGRVEKPAVRRCPDLRWIRCFGDQADRSERAGLRIEPPRVNTLGRGVRITAHVHDVVGCSLCAERDPGQQSREHRNHAERNHEGSYTNTTAKGVYAWWFD